MLELSDQIVKLEPLSTVRLLQSALTSEAITGSVVVTSGIMMSSLLVGITLPSQFAAVFQSALEDPSHVRVSATPPSIIGRNYTCPCSCSSPGAVFAVSAVKSYTIV